MPEEKGKIFNAFDFIHKNWFKKILISILAICFIFSIFLICLAYEQLYYNTNTGHIVHLGVFGDFISGTVGILISLVGIIAVFFAYSSQREQIKIQEKELRELKIKNKIDNFEKNFYQLLELLNNISNKDVQKQSRQFDNIFFDMYDKLVEFIKTLINNELNDIIISDKELIKNISVEKLKEYFNQCYMRFYKSYFHDVSEYFRILYNILKLIDKNKITLNNGSELTSKFYSNILRAKLSQKELYIIFFNALSDRAKTKPENKTLQSYLEEFELFEHFEINDISAIAFMFLQSSKNIDNYNNKKELYIDKDNVSNVLVITSAILNFYKPKTYGLNLTKISEENLKVFENNDYYHQGKRIVFK